MTYQQVVDLIRTVALAVNTGATSANFVHGRRTDVSIESIADFDNTYPLIYLLPVRTVVDRPNSNTTHTIVMGFFKQDRPDTSNAEREAIIAAMYTLCNSFMDYLDENYNYRIDNEAMTPEYRQLAGTASGYGLTFTLIAKMGCSDGES